MFWLRCFFQSAGPLSALWAAVPVVQREAVLLKEKLRALQGHFHLAWELGVWRRAEQQGSLGRAGDQAQGQLVFENQTIFFEIH